MPITVTWSPTLMSLTAPDTDFVTVVFDVVATLVDSPLKSLIVNVEPLTAEIDPTVPPPRRPAKPPGPP